VTAASSSIALRRAPSLISRSLKPRVHACPAQENATLRGDNAFEHSFDVVEAFRRFLASFRSGYCVGHEKDHHLQSRIFFQQCVH
jgi:hypothetical protein